MAKKVRIWIFFFLMIFINAFIIYQSCLPSESSSHWSNFFVDVVKGISRGNISGASATSTGLSVSDFIRKMIGHYLLFGVNAICTYLFFYYLYEYKRYPYYYLHILWALLIGMLVSILTEVIQLHVNGRAGDINDVLINISGFIFFLSVLVLIVTIKKIVTFKKQQISCNPLN